MSPRMWISTTLLLTNYPKTGDVAAEVCRYMEQALKKPVAKEEIGFLAIHIQRVIAPETE